MAPAPSHLAVVTDATTEWEELKKSFIETFGSGMPALADEGNWTLEARGLACNYVKALVNGDGTIPAELQNKVIIQAVQRVFVETCQQIRIIGLPGQRQPWYPGNERRSHGKRPSGNHAKRGSKPRTTSSASKRSPKRAARSMTAQSA